MDRSKFINSVIDREFPKVNEHILGGVNINERDSNGWTALHFASQNGDVEIGKLLIDNGADIDSKDNYGNTPLWRATFSSNGDGKFIKLLLKHGANKNIENNHNVSPFILANTIDNFDVKKYFES